MSFDIIKKELQKSENQIPATLISGIASAVPFVGGLLSNSINASFTHFQEKKRKQFLDIILSNKENITSDKVNEIEFIINFTKTLEAVNRLSTYDKIQYFANLLKNSYFTENKIINDEYEEYLALLNYLSYREIFILIKFSKTYWKIPKSELDGGYMDKPLFRDFMQNIISEFNITECEVADILMKLQNNSLCKFEFSHGFDNDSDCYASLMTEYSRKFIERIKGSLVI